MIYIPKTIKTNRNKPVKTHSTTPVYVSAEVTRKAKKKHPKTRRRSKTTQTSKTKARKQTVKTTTLFVLPEPLQMEKKNRDNVKNSVKIFAHNK